MKKLLEVLGKVAPVVAQALRGNLAGVVLNALGALFGSKDPDKVAAAIEADPLTAQAKLAELELELDRLFVADTADARRREIEIVKATGGRDWFPPILSWIITTGFFTLTSLLMWKPLPPEANPVVFTLFGALSTAFVQVVAYYFGSSKGSADKTRLLAGLEKRDAHGK